MGMVYQWKPQAGIKIEAQVAGEELERIRVRNNGRLTQEDVLDEAKNAASPLHPAFEWNDKKAAHQYRLTQAGYLIRMITVAPAEPEAATTKPVRAFVNVERESDRSYTSVAHALSDQELRAQVLARAMKELHDWRQRYQDLVELARVFSVVDEERNRLAG